MPEALRNYVGKAEWDEKKNAQDFYGGDFEAQERAEKFGGFGTDAGGLVGAIKASHGSPHAFDRFDFTKIGSGEGAQAYGHGGYFAQGFDSPVAKQYQENVKDMDSIRAINDRMKELSRIMESDSAGQYRKFKSDVGRDAASEYDALMDQRSAVRQDPGHLYNVELKWPDPAREAADPLGEHHLLDWDAPLSQQPEGVRKALEVIDPDTYHPEGFDYDPTELGQSIYQRLANSKRDYAIAANKLQDTTLKGMQSAASRELAELGIPGIRYLDQGSRSAGKGSRNYVMFDDQFPEIVSRNGQVIAEALRGAK
jgi:hypothetical protein